MQHKIFIIILMGLLVGCAKKLPALGDRDSYYRTAYDKIHCNKEGCFNVSCCSSPWR